ncbi:MAG: chemotaxis protein CheW [Deltaproteobacteria bacterium]|nr:chemotaxis protein CheW [Deltaproteobacteria bacterium]
MEAAANQITQQPVLAKHYVTFRAGELFFGIDVLQVQEIIRHQSMTPVPLAPAAVKGLINLRGQIIAALDLRSILGAESGISDERTMNVVVRADDETISLLVDSIGDVIQVDERDFENVPETIAPHIRCILHGVFKLKNELMLVLNSGACMERE